MLFWTLKVNTLIPSYFRSCESHTPTTILKYFNFTTGGNVYTDNPGLGYHGQGCKRDGTCPVYFFNLRPVPHKNLSRFLPVPLSRKSSAKIIILQSPSRKIPSLLHPWSWVRTVFCCFPVFIKYDKITNFSKTWCLRNLWFFFSKFGLSFKILNNHMRILDIGDFWKLGCFKYMVFSYFFLFYIMSKCMKFFRNLEFRNIYLINT